MKTYPDDSNVEVNDRDVDRFLYNAMQINTGIYDRASVIAARKSAAVLGVDEELALQNKDSFQNQIKANIAARALEDKALTVDWLKTGSNALIGASDAKNLAYFEQLTNSVKRGYHNVLDQKAHMDLYVYSQLHKQALKGADNPEEVAAAEQAYHKKLHKTFTGISERAKASEELGYSEFQKEFGEAKDYKQGLKALGRYPLQASLDVLPQSAVTAIPVLAAALLTGGATAPVVAAGATFGFLSDYASHFNEVAADLGVNLADPVSVAEAWSDPYKRREITRRSLAHGAAVGIASGASAYLAGTSALVRRSHVGTNASTVSKKAIAISMAKQMAGQGALGAGGEYAGQRLAGEEISGKDIALEGVAELAGSPAEAASLAISKNSRIGDESAIGFQTRQIADLKRKLSGMILKEGVRGYRTEEDQAKPGAGEQALNQSGVSVPSDQKMGTPEQPDQAIAEGRAATARMPEAAQGQSHGSMVKDLVESSSVDTAMAYRDAVEYQKTSELQKLLDDAEVMLERTSLRKDDPVAFKEFIDSVDENHLFLHPEHFLRSVEQASPAVQMEIPLSLLESAQVASLGGTMLRVSAGDYFAFLTNVKGVRESLSTDPFVSSSSDVQAFAAEKSQQALIDKKDEIKKVEDNHKEFMRVAESRLENLKLKIDMLGSRSGDNDKLNMGIVLNDVQRTEKAIAGSRKAFDDSIRQLVGKDTFAAELLDTDSRVNALYTAIRSNPNSGNDIKKAYGEAAKKKTAMVNNTDSAFVPPSVSNQKDSPEVLKQKLTNYLNAVIGRAVPAKEAEVYAQLYANFFESISNLSGMPLDMIYRGYVPAFEKRKSSSTRGLGATIFRKQKSGAIKDILVSLYGNSDVSTMLHETGHVFLEVFVDIVKSSPTPESKAYLNKILRWLKYDGVKLTRHQHELFANSFMDYMTRAQPKNSSMIELFRLFKDWLISSYKGLRSKVDPVPSEVEEVLDILVQNKQEVLEAATTKGFLPMIDSTMLQGNRPEQYRSLYTEFLYDSRETLDRDMLSLYFSEITEAQMAMAVREIDKLPVYKAEEVVRKAKGFSTQSVQGSIYYEMLKKRGLVSDAGEITPALAAISIGYDGNLSNLLGQMASPIKKESVIRSVGLLIKSMEEKPESYVNKVFKSMLGDSWTKFILGEMMLMQKLSANKESITDAVVSQAVSLHNMSTARDADIENSISGMHNNYFKNNPLERALSAIKANLTAKGIDKYGEMYQKLSRAQHRIVKENTTRGFLLSHLKDVSSALGVGADGKQRSEPDKDYAKSIESVFHGFDYIAEELGLGKSSTNEVKRILMSGKTLDTLTNMEVERVDQYFQEISDLADNPEINPEKAAKLVKGSRRANKQIELGKKLEGSKDPKEKADLYEQIAKLTGQSVDRTVKGKLTNLLEKARFKHLKLSTLTHMLDSNETNGFFWQAITKPANEHHTNEIIWRKKAFAFLSEKLTPALKQKGMFSDGIWYESINRSLNGSERLSLLLNLGNEGNKERLLRGLKVKSVDDIKDVLLSVTDADIEAAKTVFSYMDVLKKELIDKLPKNRLKGWVQASPITIPRSDGSSVKMRGGYYHIMYDYSLSPLDQDAKFSPEEVNAYVPGAAKSRSKDGLEYPIKLDISNIFSTVSDLIHYGQWHEWVVQAKLLLHSGQFKDAVLKTHGKHMLTELNSAVDDIDVGYGRDRSSFDQTLAYLRRGVVMSKLGFNPRTVLVQLGSFIPATSSALVGPKYICRGFAQFMASPREAIRDVNVRSAMMQQRALGHDRDLSEFYMDMPNTEIDKVLNKAKMKQFQDYMMAPLKYVMMTQDYPIWLGTYEKSLDAGLGEDTAIALADQMVLDVIGGSHRKDLSSVQSGSELVKLFTVFYSFFNNMYNLYVKAETTPDATVRKMRLTQHVIYGLLLTSLADAALRELYLQSTNPEADEFTASGFLGHFSNTVVQQALGAFIGVREASNLLTPVLNPDEFYGYTGLTSLSIIGDFYRMVENLAKEDNTLNKLKSVNNFSSIIIGYPSTPVRIALQQMFENE